MSIYTDKGYKDREDYLRALGERLEVPHKIVLILAGMLGPDEDFDGLVVALYDYDETLPEEFDE